MAQHDYVIDNSTGANVRADINSVLQAISSNNSGSSAPSTTYALQSFANTTDSMLQLRNAANNAFVNLRKFDGSLPLPDGSVSSPSLFFNDDTNTGIFSSAANHFCIATDGSEVFTIDEVGRVGIGDTNPNNELNVKGATPQIRLEETATGNSKRLDLEVDSSLAKIGANQSAQSMAFSTASNEAMRIDSSGNVGIGTTNPTNATLEIVEAASTLAIKVKMGTSTSQSSHLNLENNSTGNLFLGVFGSSASAFGIINDSDGFINSSDDLCILSGNANGVIKFGTGANGATEAMRIQSGNVLVGKTSSNIGVIGCELHTNGFASFARSGLGAVAVNRGTNNGTVISLQRSGTEVGTIAVTTSNTSFNTSGSDRSLKKNFEDWTENTLNLFKNIKPQKFNFIVEEDTEAKTKGYIAQDLVDSFPEAYPKNDNDKYMFNPSGMVVYLMKAIQELEAKVAALEAA